MSSIDDQLKEIREVVYKNKETTDRLEANWDKDRKDFSEFQNRLGHLETEFKTLREQILKLPEQTKEKVQTALEPMQTEAKDLKDAIVEKKVVAIDIAKATVKKWWQFWKGR